MYNNIGILTPRGTGTSGHVQSNKFNLRRAPVPRFQENQVAAPPTDKKPNQAILEHNKKRQIEIKLIEIRDELEEQGLSAEDIDAAISKKREELLAEYEQEKEQGAADATNETHAIAQRKVEQMEKMRKAFGLGEVVWGEAFDPEVQERKKQERIEQRQKAEKEAYERREAARKEKDERIKRREQEQKEREERAAEQQRQLELERSRFGSGRDQDRVYYNGRPGYDQHPGRGGPYGAPYDRNGGYPGRGRYDRQIPREQGYYGTGDAVPDRYQPEAEDEQYQLSYERSRGRAGADHHAEGREDKRSKGKGSSRGKRSPSSSSTSSSSSSSGSSSASGSSSSSSGTSSSSSSGSEHSADSARRGRGDKRQQDNRKRCRDDQQPPAAAEPLKRPRAFIDDQDRGTYQLAAAAEGRVKPREDISGGRSGHEQLREYDMRDDRPPAAVAAAEGSGYRPRDREEDRALDRQGSGRRDTAAAATAAAAEYDDRRDRHGDDRRYERQDSGLREAAAAAAVAADAERRAQQSSRRGPDRTDSGRQDSGRREAAAAAGDADARPGLDRRAEDDQRHQQQQQENRSRGSGHDSRGRRETDMRYDQRSQDRYDSRSGDRYDRNGRGEYGRNDRIYDRSEADRYHQRGGRALQGPEDRGHGGRDSYRQSQGRPAEDRYGSRRLEDRGREGYRADSRYNEGGRDLGRSGDYRAGDRGRDEPYAGNDRDRGSARGYARRGRSRSRSRSYSRSSGGSGSSESSSSGTSSSTDDSRRRS